MRALPWALLFAPLLLHSSWGDPPLSSRGEWCRIWASPGAVFWCPRTSDKADAQFCCGTCSLPYCCSFKGRRLDQPRCPPWISSEDGVEGSSSNSKPPKASDLFSVSFLVTLAVISLLVGLVVCYSKEQRCRVSDVVARINQALRRLGAFARHPTQLFHQRPHDNPPPPYTENDLPPPYSEEDPQRPRGRHLPTSVVYLGPTPPENPEGEVVFGALVHRNVPTHISDSSTEKDSSGDE